MSSDLSTPALLGSAAISSKMFRARDVRANIKELGFEKGIELSLTVMADEMIGHRQAVKQMGELLSQALTILEQMTQVNGAMAQQINEMKRLEDQYAATQEAHKISTRN